MESPWIRIVGLDETNSRPVAERLNGAGVPAFRAVNSAEGGVGILVVRDLDRGLVDRLCSDYAPLDVRAAVLVVSACPAPDVLARLREAGLAEVRSWEDRGPCAGTIAARIQRWLEIERLLRDDEIGRQACAASLPMRRLLRDLLEVAVFTTDPILILGETGTGKESVARLVHAVDRRVGKRDLVVVDCSTIPAELSASEFFGHERGAFTGALAPRDGAIAMAHEGTLFLDEVGELTPAMQAQLLRVVQEKAFKRVGGGNWQRSEFRLVCATHRGIDDGGGDGGEGGFRRDFFHRIARWVFRLPTLAERAQDILPLADSIAAVTLGSSPGFDRDTSAFLAGREYPGNVRDLRNLVLRMCGRHVGAGPITLNDLATQDLGAGRGVTARLDAAAEIAALAGTGLKTIERKARDAAIRAALSASGNSVPRAARLLQISDRALQMELAKRSEAPIELRAEEA